MGIIDVKELHNFILGSLEHLKEDIVVRREFITKYSLNDIDMESFNSYFDSIFCHKCIFNKNIIYSDIEFERIIKKIDIDKLNDYFIYANELIDFEINEDSNLLDIIDKVIYFMNSDYFDIVNDVIDKKKDIVNYFNSLDYYSMDLELLISFIDRIKSSNDKTIKSFSKFIVDSYLSKIKNERNKLDYNTISELKVFNEKDKYILITNYLYNVLFNNLDYDVNEYVNYNNEYVKYLIDIVNKNRVEEIKPKNMYLLLLEYKDYLLSLPDENISGIIILLDMMKKYDRDNFNKILISMINSSGYVLCELIGKFQYYYKEILSDNKLFEKCFINIINSDVSNNTFEFMCNIFVYDNNFTNERIILESLKKYDRFIIIMNKMNDELFYHQNNYLEMFELFRKYIDYVKDDELLNKFNETIVLYG